MHMGSSAGLTALDANPIYAGTKSHVVCLKRNLSAKYTTLLQINFSRSIEQLYPTSKTGIIHHVFYPAFIRTSLTTFLTNGKKIYALILTL